MTPKYTALYDANVLYPSLLRNLLMHLAVSGLVAARWTDAIHDEWGRNLLLNRPDLGAPRVQWIRALMKQAVPDALLLALFEGEFLTTRAALEALRGRFQPPVTWEDLTERLAQSGLIRSVAEIRNT
ncbi:hypothetical protein [Deinococcus aquaticus]|uniref:hypothetical protein n=1 Tax=Deinococcus aquaticus TaxID=328692 RepID=UPI003F48DB58